MIKNPFSIIGYIGAEYFCDRARDTKRLTDLLVNGNNIVLISPRRIGKTGLLSHVFAQNEVKENYYTFLIDIYSTRNIDEMVQEMGKSIVQTLSKQNETALHKFLQIVNSLRATMSFDPFGNPSWGIEKGNMQPPEYTLDQIFNYMEQADKPCVVAIDEFQQITKYPEKNVEAILRTKIQHCKRCSFIFSGSEQSVLGQMFHSPARPFFASTHTYALDVIPEDSYVEFVQHHFRHGGKDITREAIHETYEMFEGVTWYLQKVMNSAYSMTNINETCTEKDILHTVDTIIKETSITYTDILYQLPSRQKDILIAISKERKATEITGQTFVKKYNLPSTSTIQAAVKSLLDKQLVTVHQGVYEVYDKFLSLWLER